MGNRDDFGCSSFLFGLGLFIGAMIYVFHLMSA